MARRADHTREELMRLAVKAGLNLIKKEGFSHFSARKVATDIGYTVGTLYNVFGSYDDFILHINACTLDEWFSSLQEALNKSGKKNAVHTLAKAYIDYSRNSYHQWVALFEHHMDKGREVPDWYQSKMARFFTLTEQTLLPVLENNRRKTKRAARVLWAGIHGICILFLSGKLDLAEVALPETLAFSFIDNYITGLISEK